MSMYTQQASAPPLARSNSFFGAIKNIVTAPFTTWFGAAEEDEVEDGRGKRRRLAAVPEDTPMGDETAPSRAKRMRVSSPDRDSQSYLDPPGSAFTHLRRTSAHSVPGAVRDVTRSPRKTLHVPSSSNQLPRNRRTVSPLPSGSHLRHDGATRTMSLDPPARSGFSSLSSRIQPAPTIPNLLSESNHARGSTSSARDASMSPRRIRVRSSLTPQPSGASFGPVVPPRRERGPDEPPPLASLMSNPMFVRPPGPQKQSTAEPPKQLTLGTLIDSQRSARAPSRQSSILFGTGSMTDVSARHVWPVNKAEIALHELEVYKTPLLPTRLKGATAVPDMFMHKEKKHVTLMTDDRPVKPRLGTKVKGKERGKKKERERGAINGTKPYAGEGGMKKWLARRKREEEEAKERESAEAMEDEKAEEEKKRKEAEAERKKREEELKVPLPPPAPAFEPRVSHEGLSRSSLRVGRTRTGRNHLERPVSRRAKFSAAFEDEDEEMEESRTAEQKVLEEAAKKAPLFELPVGFTFAKETTLAHDLTHAKEPPITSLPFSLSKPAVRATPPAVVETTIVPPIIAPPILAPPPTVSLVPPTPETIKVASEASSIPAAAPSSVPNFFANSSVFAKPAPVTAQPPAPTVQAAEQPKRIEISEPNVPKAAGATPPLFGAPSQPISVFGTPTSNSTAPPAIGVPAAIPKEAEKSTTTTSSLASPFSFGAPAKPLEPVAVPTLSLPLEKPLAAEPAKPAAAPQNGTPFAFGAPSPVPAPAAISTPGAPTANVEAPKSVFTFGQPAPAAAMSTSTVAPVIAVPTADTKPLFGAAPPAAPFSFGERQGTAPTVEKSATSPFAFAPTADKKPTIAFGFGSSNASTAPPAAPATFSFGAPTGTTTADVSSKPFSFGATAPARPVTPPKNVQEVTMDESPARDMVVNGTSKAPERPTLNFPFTPPSGSALFAQSPATTTAPFSFGAPGSTTNPFAKEEKKETKPAVPFGGGFGQGSTGFPFGQKPPESPATAAPATAPFQFAQPSPSAAPPSPFTFGAPPTSATGFGQPSVASAPSSPSFNRPSAFAFGPPSMTQPASNPFSFGTGSQPASPAAGSTTLPSATTGSTPFAFGGGTNAAAPAVAGFGAPAAAAAPTGGSLFTIGSAPPPAEGAGGRRIIKGLPRRGARR